MAQSRSRRDVVRMMGERGPCLFVASLVLGLAAGASAAAAQESKPSHAIPPGIPKLTVTAQEVLVPVVVTDKKGRHITSLKASDFDVFEDGVKQRIVAFSRTFDSAGRPGESLSRAPGSSTVAPVIKPADAPARTYLVCVDSIHSSFGNWGRARSALSKFFTSEQDSEAQYALINLARQLEVMQDSTRDASAVLNALRSKKFQASILDSEASNIAYEKEQLRYMLQTFSPSACINAPSVRVRGQIPDNCNAMKQKVRAFIDGSAERTAVLTRAFIRELNAVVDALASMPTARTLVLISDGFNLIPGQELYGIAAAYFPDVAEFRSNYRATQAELDSVLRKAEKSNVVVYALDSRGLYSQASTGNDFDAASSYQGNMRTGQALNEMDNQEKRVAWENGSTMAQLASATGGTYFHDNNDLLSRLRRAFDDARARYTLAYVPANGDLDGKFRKITVEVKDQKLHVSAKAGYWAASSK